MGLIPLLNLEEPAHCDNLMVIEGIKTASEQLDRVIREISEKTNSAEIRPAYIKQYQNNTFLKENIAA